MGKKQLKVIYTEKGLANFFGDHIEINRRLKDKKKLRDYIMKHELGHKESFDIWHEFQIDWKVMPSLILFVFKNPSTWKDFLPIQFSKKKIIFDFNLLIIYSFVISLSILVALIFIKLLK